MAGPPELAAEQKSRARCDIVLVVDDDHAVREALKFALELEGLVVRTCDGGPELLHHPDLLRARCLVLDYKMPLMDGFDVLEQLAARRIRIPVILITGYASPGLRRRADAAGVRYLLEKPLSDDALLDGINDVLGRRTA